MEGVFYWYRLIRYNVVMSFIDELAESTAKEIRVKKALTILAHKYDESTKVYLTTIYSDPSIQDSYNALREAAKYHKISDPRRLVVKYPNMIVYKFLDDVFAPKYGPDWATDKTILAKVLNREDLIQPWKIANL